MPELMIREKETVAGTYLGRKDKIGELVVRMAVEP